MGSCGRDSLSLFGTDPSWRGRIVGLVRRFRKPVDRKVSRVRISPLPPSKKSQQHLGFFSGEEARQLWRAKRCCEAICGEHAAWRGGGQPEGSGWRPRRGEGRTFSPSAIPLRPSLRSPFQASVGQVGATLGISHFAGAKGDAHNWSPLVPPPAAELRWDGMGLKSIAQSACCFVTVNGRVSVF